MTSSDIRLEETRRYLKETTVLLVVRLLVSGLTANQLAEVQSGCFVEVRGQSWLTASRPHGGDSEWKNLLARNYVCIVRTIYWIGTDFIPVATQGTAANKKNLMGCVSSRYAWLCPDTSVSDILHDCSDWPKIMWVTRAWWKVKLVLSFHWPINEAEVNQKPSFRDSGGVWRYICVFILSERFNSLSA